MKKLLKFLKPYILQSILAPLFKFTEAAFELIVPLIVADIIDAGIPSGDMKYILGKCGILVLFAFVGYGIAIIAQYFSSVAAVGFASKCRSSVFEKIQNLSYRELDTIGTSTLITRMTSDINQMQTGVNLFLRLLLRSPFVVFGALVMAFTIDKKLSLIFLGVIVVLFFVVYLIMYITLPKYKMVQGNLDQVLLKTKENLDGVRVIRAFGREEEEEKEFKEQNEVLNRSQIRVGRISSLTSPLTTVLINLAIVLVIYFGGVQVKLGNLTQGQVIALFNYMSQILVELIKLANFIITETKALASAKRVESVLDMESTLLSKEKLDAEATNDDAITFDHVSFTYAGAGAPSIEDISFSIPKGGILGIIGGTGSGKSTLVNLIPRFYDVTDGKVLINGIPVNEYPIDELRKKIGVVSQNKELFSGTIKENILWGNEQARDEDIQMAIELSQSEDVISRKKLGLDEMVEPHGKNFSGGQKQRLTIARALVRKPEILILDDAASALDFATEAKLRRALKTLNQMTQVIISQRTSSIQHADLILVLEDGKIVGMGTHKELLDTCEVYREIDATQRKGGDR